MNRDGIRTSLIETELNIANPQKQIMTWISTVYHPPAGCDITSVFPCAVANSYQPKKHPKCHWMTVNCFFIAVEDLIRGLINNAAAILNSGSPEWVVSNLLRYVLYQCKWLRMRGDMDVILGEDARDMSPALFQNAVFVPCSFSRPKTMLRYIKQRLVRH